MNESKSAARTHYVGTVEQPLGWITQTPLEQRGIRGRRGVTLQGGVYGDSGYVLSKNVLDKWHGFPVPFFERRLQFAVNRAKSVVRRAVRG